ncbi:hypothetical protein Poli38472_000214 [Pythium oligandrum]|uniref:Cation efflux protein cytoplasmic domain-containing protein n=1 Tax=Pythium oligandrum TaxID=41045 RepID=A0A8K1CBJ3_PYTOL|nr:hypothetical protein Poli38472_000214 [Pythium oligandrum]|eukprot:TMW60172.1 hypothetical protein Poli38472_000214 [Pythium oligandrum]
MSARVVTPGSGKNAAKAVPLLAEKSKSYGATDAVVTMPPEMTRGDSKESSMGGSGRKIQRSQVAHSLIRRQSDTEISRLEPAASLKVQIAIRVSLIINVILAALKTYAAIASGSLAVLSSLVDTILDLTSQWLFWYSDKHMHTPHVNYPAGRRRLEPIAVIVSATLMGMAAIEVIQKSIETLVVGFNGTFPDLEMSTFTIGVLFFAIVVKICLWFICARIGTNSPSAAALAQDHRNDVFSNVVAVTTSLLAHWHRDIWYADSIGAIAISVYIAFSWLVTGKEQVERLVGLRADPDFIEQIRDLTDSHHPLMKSDIIRAYHFGNNYLVELEVILPASMCVREAHDISLALQHKVEELETVERAFVHVDYLSRDYDEHKDPTIRRDSNNNG